MEGKNIVLNWKQAWSDNQKSVKRKAKLACLVAMKKVKKVVEKKTHEKEENKHMHTP